jgi:hypothetical protein
MNLRALVAFFAALLLWSALGSPVQAREPAEADGPLVTLCSSTDGTTLAHPDEAPAPPVDPLLDGWELLPPSDLAATPCRVAARAHARQAKALTSAWLAALMRPPCPRVTQA